MTLTEAIEHQFNESTKGKGAGVIAYHRNWMGIISDKRKEYVTEVENMSNQELYDAVFCASNASGYFGQKSGMQQFRAFVSRLEFRRRLEAVDYFNDASKLKSIISCLVEDMDNEHGTCEVISDCQICLDVQFGKEACNYEIDQEIFEES